MPLLEPQEDQTEEEFMEVCMLDDLMNEEFPEDDDRQSACQKQWEGEDEDEEEVPVEDEPVEEEEEESAPVKPAGAVEKRFAKSDVKLDGKNLSGYAILYNSLSVVMGDWQERIMPGAFDKWMEKDPDVFAILQHDYIQPLARTSKGTLELNSDETGVAFKLELPDTTFAKDLVASIEHGDIEGMSFGMIPTEESWVREDGMDIREIKEAVLDHISPVTTPAYEETTVSVRANTSYKKFKELAGESKRVRATKDGLELDHTKSLDDQDELKTPLLDKAELQQRQKEAELKH